MNKKINWTKWGVIISALIAIVSLFTIKAIQNNYKQTVPDSPCSVNTIGQSGGTNNVDCTKIPYPIIKKQLIYKKDLETRYIVTIESPVVSLGYLTFEVTSPDPVVGRLDVLPLSGGSVPMVSSNGEQESLTSYHWKKYTNPYGSYRVTIYSQKPADFSLTFKSDKEIQVKEE